MAKSKKSDWLRVDARGGKAAMIPHCVLTSDAYRTASDRAKAALMVLLTKFNGFNNGRIILSTAHLAHGLGNQNYRANARAMAELEARGLAVLAKHYSDGSRRAREYRVTFIPTATAAAATNEYLAWREGDAGTQKERGWRRKRLAATATTSGASIVAAAIDEKVSVDGGATELAQKDAKPPFLGSGSAAATATHIISHPRPQSVRNGPEARCSVTGITTTSISPAPPSDELRARVCALITCAGRGSQKVLADLANLSPGALSKFANNCGELSDLRRIRLTCAIPEAELRLRPDR